MSKLQVDDIVNKEDNGSVGFSRGAVVTGVITATSFSGTLTGGASGDFSIADKIIHTGDIDTAIRFPTNNTVTVETASTERFRVTSAGKVGIGTVDPDTPLEVSGGTALDTATFNSHHANGTLINLQRSGTSKGFLGSGKNIADATGGVDDIGLRANANLIFATGGGTERVRIDSSGRLLIGTSTSRSIGAGSGYPGKLQIESSGFTNTTFTQNTNDIYGPEVNLGKSRGTSSGGTTVVQSGDQLGIIQFAGADGTDLETNAAAIECKVDGTPGSNDMPGRLTFSTTADGASSTTERLRITSEGLVQIATSTTSSFPDRLLSVGDHSRASSYIDIRSSTVGGLLFADGTSGDAAYRGQVAYNHSDDSMQLWTAAGERMRIHSGGVVSVNAGIELGSGVDATAANTLDDYEEGTFTPTINTGFTAGYNSQAGRYTKVGNVVHFFISIDLSSLSGSSSDVYAEVEGLPFTATNTGNIDNGVTISWQMNLGNSVEYGYIEHSTTSIVLLGEPSGGMRTHWNPGQVWDDNNCKLALSGTYTTTA